MFYNALSNCNLLQYPVISIYYVNMLFLPTIVFSYL